MRIYISSPIGGGKSTVAKLVSIATGIPCILAKLEEKHYIQEPKSAYDTQMNVSGRLIALDKYDGIFDESLFGVLAFTKLGVEDRTITKRQEEDIKSVVYPPLNIICSEPMRYVALNLTPMQCYMSAKKRGRSFENGLTEEFMDRLDGKIKEVEREWDLDVEVIPSSLLRGSK